MSIGIHVARADRSPPPTAPNPVTACMSAVAREARGRRCRTARMAVHRGLRRHGCSSMPSAATRRRGSCATRRRPTEQALDDGTSPGAEVEPTLRFPRWHAATAYAAAHRFAFQWLDLDHLGTEVGQHLRPSGPATKAEKSRTRSPRETPLADRTARRRRRGPCRRRAGTPRRRRDRGPRGRFGPGTARPISQVGRQRFARREDGLQGTPTSRRRDPHVAGCRTNDRHRTALVEHLLT
jgi:hypothetical protein